MKLRLSEISNYIGPVVVPKTGDAGEGFNPTPQDPDCDCVITPTRVEGLWDVELCDRHDRLVDSKRP
jgi:hypothetical protein